MFEATLSEASLLKKIVDSIRELVTDANLDCSDAGINMQAMDSSHVSLCALSLRNDGFDHFRCDRNLSLGVNLANLSKILKCAGNTDLVTLKSEDDADTLGVKFESAKQDRISEFELKLIALDAEHLGIPDTNYKAQIRMPSTDFQRIIRDLQVIGDTCTISATKEGVRFSVEGDLGAGNIAVKQNPNAEKEEEKVEVHIEEPVSLTFALRYLNFFTKATPLGPIVALSMSPDVPIVVEYPIDTTGFVRFYLAPKIDEDEE
ncbi:pcna-like protein [Tribonema minus]|uniref:DNA sliding clamp PCNA n=1 Tax=Tribonema minus TaxID=303371 RepID=A0A835YRT1_9STRA|nr:pcna-like protein [Tribonema minus]|eukprot:TRINITY_DN1176_c0_g2_i1.p1 TRINITY_DN1176_c0_g2~~TRINITY_DN1176_c0_g2_i1.p1  ORF type:complete len:261 (-),score=99.75 TRINITY_DN1176_c0_g2_i1:291-1073(-)